MPAVQSTTEKLQRRLNRLEKLLNERVSIATEIIKEEVVNAIKTRMFASQYSTRIIDNVEVRDVKITQKKIKYKIFNELIVSNGFDAAAGREKGTRPHDIFGNPLAWRGQTIIGTPTTIFATHVRHPGIEATHIIRDTVRETRTQVQERYSSLIKNKIQEIRNSS